MKLINKYVKSAFFLLVLFTIFCPNIVSAQLDQRCFSKSGCIEARVNNFGMTEQEALEGFYKAKETVSACGQKVYSPNTGKREDAGFCLPSGKSKTEISFGGKTEFATFPQFIKYMYKWSMIAASVLAVLMIIIAGIEYMMSMGNSSIVTSAKNKAVGAISGIILLAGSYVLLNTINPALVNLRLPSVWLLREVNTNPLYCQDIKATRKTRLAKIKEKNNSDTPDFKNGITLKQIKNKKVQTCGNEYIVEQNSQKCVGNTCKQDGFMCSIWKEKPECIKANIAGIITGNETADFLGGVVGAGVQFFADEGWESPWTNEPDLYHLCGYGYNNIDIKQTSDSITVDASIKNTDNAGKKQNFTYSLTNKDIDKAVKGCRNKKFRGFALAIQFNENAKAIDETHYLGKEGAQAVDLGDSPAFGFSAQSKPSVTKKMDRYLFQPNELKEGVFIRIDANKIADIDGPAGGLAGLSYTLDDLKIYEKLYKKSGFPDPNSIGNFYMLDRDLSSLSN